MRKTSFLLFLSLFFWFTPHAVHSQQPLQQINPENTWKTALDLFEKEKYAAAQQYFQLVQKDISNVSDFRYRDCIYYDAFCALKLFNKDATIKFEHFIETYPTDSRINRINFLLGHYYYGRKKFAKALPYFKKVDSDGLNISEKSEYHYSYGYCLFVENQLKEARDQFNFNANNNDPFLYPATYYLAFIDYTDKNYDQALKGFSSLKKAPGFSDLVPYHMAQIYFMQKKYDQVIELVNPVFDETPDKYKTEMARILAQSYFSIGEYPLAEPYFVIYFDQGSGFSREDYYAHGYTLYQNQKCDEAVPLFKQVLSVNDTLSQIAVYTMGACYSKLDQLKKAQVAFASASKYDFNRTVKEDALLNYARISYQLSFDPYDEAIQAFENYLETFPNAERKDEAYLFLLEVYLKTKNYNAALQVIEKIKNPNAQVENAYQLSVFNLGIESLSLENLDEALRYMKWVERYNFNQLLLADALYWQADILYQQKNYRGAIEKYDAFFTHPGHEKSAHINRARYGMAYAYYQLKQLNPAELSFQAFIDVSNDKKRLADAYLRMGDIMFFRKAYQNAIASYNQALSFSDRDRDYAIYQKAMAFGYLDQVEAKIDFLNKLVQDFPQTEYKTQAYYELGNAYFETANYPLAIKNYAAIESLPSGNWLLPEARLKTGLVYIRTGKNKEASGIFQKIITDFPQSDQAAEALLSLRTVDLNAFNQLARTYTYDLISEEDIDAANYEEAESEYLDENYASAIPLFIQYTDSFPSGRFRQNAWYYLTDSYLHLNQKESALEVLKNLILIEKGVYYEPSVEMAAKIADDLDQPIKAYDYYQKLYTITSNDLKRLETEEKLIQLGFLLKDYPQVMHYCQNLRKNSKSSPKQKQKAWLIQIKSLINNDQKPEAILVMDSVDTEVMDENGAELAYLKAEWMFEQAKYEAAEDALFHFLQNYSSYPDWRAKGFILLGDVYLKMNDPFQAKATWQSVVDHHQGEDLRKMAQQKLDALDQQVESPLPVKDTVELEFNPQTGLLTDGPPSDTLVTDSLPRINSETLTPAIDSLKTNNNHD